MDYINNKSEELLYVSGLKERPVKEEKSVFENNVVWAAAESTSWVSRVCFEQVLLNEYDEFLKSYEQMKQK